MNSKVDAYIIASRKWQEEIRELRRIALDCQLAEEFKWGVPCYTFQGRNIVLIHVFKEYCALLLFKGALLSDADGVLVRQTDNTQAARQIRFTDVREIREMEAVVKACLYEAIEVEKAGLNVAFKTTEEFTVPEEFRSRLENDPNLQAAFDALTPGRQRAYLLHFSAARQSKTRESRIEKNLQKILDGQGLHE